MSRGTYPFMMKLKLTAVTRHKCSVRDEKGREVGRPDAAFNEVYAPMVFAQLITGDCLVVRATPPPPPPPLRPSVLSNTTCARPPLFCPSLMWATPILSALCLLRAPVPKPLSRDLPRPLAL